MADAPVQTYANHRRYLIPWHFVIMPIVGAQVVVAAVGFFRTPALVTFWYFLVYAALFGGLFWARWMARRVQDRVVRLEETLRLERLLPGRTLDIEKLSLKQMIGLRFASDAEVPHLVDRILSGDLVEADDVKQAVQHWRTDYLRV
jgi:hypothetical protein